jgi:PAS domain S-box-containing protein
MNKPNKHITDLRKKAEEILKQDNIQFTDSAKKQWDTLLEELGIYHIELEQQNKELQDLQFQSELRKKEFENLYQNAPNAYFELNNKLEIVKCNKSALNLLHIAKNEINLKKFNQFVAPTEQDQFHKTILHVKKDNKATYATTLRDIEKVNKHVILKIELNILNKSLIRISATDISNEEKLIRANKIKETILDNVNDCIFTTDNEGYITFWGNGAERILGFTEKEMLQSNAQELFQLNKDEFLSFVNESSIVKKYEPVEIQVKNIKGEAIVFNVNISKSKTPQHSATDYIYVCQDITYQKETENNLKQAKEQTEIILNSIDQQIYITDPENLEVLFANTPMKNNFSNILHTNCHKAIFNKSKPCEFCNVKKLQKSNSLTELNNEVYIKSVDKWFKIHEKKIQWNNNKKAIVHTFTDISEIRKAEIERIEHAEMLERLTSSIADGILMVNKKGIINFWNQAAADIFGYSLKEAIGKQVHDIISLKDKNINTHEVFRSFEKPDNSRIIDKTYSLNSLKKDGSPFILELTISSVKIKNNWNAIGVIRDITKSEEEKQKLTESESRFRSIVDNIKESIYIHDFDGNFIDCNKEQLKLTGYTYEEMRKLNAGELLPEGGEEHFLNNLKQLKRNKQLIFTTLIQTKSGKKLPVEINATIINYKSINAILISGRDISERLNEHKKLLESEVRFRTMVDHLRDAIFIHNLTGEIIDTNEQAIQKLGYSREEFLKMNPLDFSNLYDNIDEYKDIINELTEKKQLKFEDEHIAKDGTIIPVEITSSIINYKNENVVFSIAHDISERKKSEKEQNKLIDQLNYLSTSATKFISLKSFDEIYRYLGKSLNRALEGSMVVVGEFNNDDFTIIDYFGLDQSFVQQFEKITGEKGLNSTFKPDKHRLELYRTGHLEKIGDLNNMFMGYFDEETRKKIGRLTEIEDIRIIGVTYDKKLFAGISIMLTKPLDTIDIEFTQALVYQASIAIQRKNYENELIRTRNEAQSANKAKSTFLTKISHEIRTPLNTIIGFTEILSNLNKDPLKESYINSIAKSGKTLLAIINDILDLSKVESGAMKINYMAISIKSLFDDLDYTFRKIAELKGINFSLSIEENVPDMIEMDQPRLRQVLHNLVSNGIKFTNEGSVSVNVEAKIDNELSTIIFSIKDTGIGIEEEKINNILQPFSQADNRDSRIYEGTGMGLSLANTITEMLGGILKIDSKPNKGSLFQVILKNVTIINDKAQKEPYRSHKFKKEKVLVIEEDVSQLEIIQSVIDKHNLVAFVAESGEQGFAFAFEFNPDFIVINLTSNKKSALQTAINIKSIDQFNKTPIIGIASRKNNDKDIYKYFDIIINTPVTDEKLIGALSKFMISDEIDDDSLESTEQFAFIIKDVAILKEILNELNKNITPLCNELKQRQPLNKVKELNKRLETISQKYKSKVIEEYSKKIDNSIKSFDIVKMRELINDYSKLVESLKAKMNN